MPKNKKSVAHNEFDELVEFFVLYSFLNKEHFIVV